MQKRKLIELVQHRLQRIDKASKYPYQVVEGYCDLAWEQILHDAFNKDLTNFDFYAKTYNTVTVSLDATSNLYYSTLPAPIVQLPDRAEGVRWIHTAQGQTNEFAPVSEDTFRLMANQEVQLLDTTIMYIVRQERVDYNPSMTSSIAAVGVTMKLVIPFSSYAETDDVVIPSGKSQQFIDTVVGFATDNRPVDLLNNNA